jgi:large subunit ribosomal protein L25
MDQDGRREQKAGGIRFQRSEIIMEIAILEVEERQAAGTRAARRLRRTGKLPAVIYGHGEAPETVAVPVRELANLLEHGAHLVELRVNGAPRQVLIKDVQFDYLGIEPVHVDFTRVDLHERVTVSVPLEFRGTPAGVNEGGLFDMNQVDIEIECLVSEIPDSIRVNVAHLRIGDMLHVRDLTLPPNVSAVTSPETVVFSVRAKVTAEAAELEETEAQPEIIGRKEKEEEEAESKEKPREKSKEK